MSNDKYTGNNVFQNDNSKDAKKPSGGQMDYTNVKKGSYTNSPGDLSNLLNFDEYQKQSELSNFDAKKTKRTSVGKDVINENNKKLLEEFTRYLSENKIQQVDENTIVEFLKNIDSGESTEE